MTTSVGCLGKTEDGEGFQKTIQAETCSLMDLARSIEGSNKESFKVVLDTLSATTGSVVITGMGKSGLIGRKISATFSSTGTLSYFLHPSEASHGDLGMVRADDVVMAISWSGESAELSDVIAYTRRFGITLVAVTSNIESALARAADVKLVLPHSPEACPNGLAPTTSTTMQLALGDSIAMCLLARKGFTADDFRQIHPGGKLGARLKRVADLMHTDDAVPLVRQEDTLSAAIVQMTSKGFGVTGVTNDKGLLLGILTDGDLRRTFKDGFYDRPVTKAMKSFPMTTRASALAADTLRRNERRGNHNAIRGWEQ